MKLSCLGSLLHGLLLSVQLIHAYNELDTISLRKLDKLSTNRLNLDPDDQRNHFVHFNKTRVPGSKESIDVQNHIINHFKLISENSDTPWEVELDNFEENNYNFTNLVFSKRSLFASEQTKATNYLVLAAHYDTLIAPEGFIGAIDSAVPCGIMLDLAESISNPVDEMFRDFSYDMNVGIKFVFFDGEEAIEKWSPTDSIYGARHLFKKWDSESRINEIELFVLLDLLGAPDVNYVPSYFPSSHGSYNDLSLLENKLIHLFPSIYGSSVDYKYLSVPENIYEKKFAGYIEDDHIPFLKAGVPILHLIPHVFPRQWHTISDDFNHVDLHAVNRWNILLRAYILEYLEISDLFMD